MVFLEISEKTIGSINFISSISPNESLEPY